jgi:hypothetical protein
MTSCQIHTNRVKSTLCIMVRGAYVFWILVHDQHLSVTWLIQWSEKKGNQLLWGQSDLTEREFHRALLAASFLLVSCFTYPSTLKMEAVCSSETSLDFYQTVLKIVLFIRSACHLRLAWLTLQPWRWRQYVPLKRHWTSTTVLEDSTLHTFYLPPTSC